MKLNIFIQLLEKIAQESISPENIEVQFADCVPVVKPILLDKVVYISDLN